jgi:hypothetical protein
MNLIGLELSDAGILAAGDNPSGLLNVDGNRRESPGFAIPENDDLLVGNSAAGKAHLVPLQVINTFWDQLSTETLKKKNRQAQNQAEIACAHLSLIWENIKMHGDGLIFAVPDHYGREQMGLILGMAQELSIPVKGFVSLPIAASGDPRPDALLMYLDIHLHRFELVLLSQGEQLTRANSLSVQDIGLEQLHRSWVEAVAEEFVRTTRFDPLHQAATEQGIYDRLPEALDIFKGHSSFIFEITQGRNSYHITLFRDMLKQKTGEVYDEICHYVEKMLQQHGQKDILSVLQLTHRIACLPGLKDRLSEIDNCEIVELGPGAGAQGVVRIWNQLTHQHSPDRTSFFTSRPWQQTESDISRVVPDEAAGRTGPTHVLYRDVAYRLSKKPLFIGNDRSLPGTVIPVQDGTPGISGKHCSIQRNTEGIVLTNYSSQGTFVDDQRINGSTTLELGQTVRLGTSGETILLITCIETDET